ncbi:MAG: bifunctional folylpolyglutamate synthase/dihydrofolate synthase [Candidatus Andersenbacteria bacterium]|nr:bifunctional folylpolyglutamate synthase/dihydrofolate synthase [Candidatus Andersenbacteria bacterium]
MQKELEYLYHLERFGIKPGLAVMKELMDVLGHPEKSFKSIHITGTNGKGSTCAMLESILRESGFKTALYTSPHLYAFNERIKVSGVAISDSDLISLIQEIRVAVEHNNLQPTFFEFTTALAFLYFARSNIDIAVIEVGMGGRLDATNVITPLLSIITNVGLDHMEFLGNTVEEIAREKAGIIKDSVPVITREEGASVVKILEDEAGRKNTQVIRAQGIVKTNVVRSDLSGQDIDVAGEKIAMRIHLPLLGAHQIKNLEVVLAACGELMGAGLRMSQEDISRGVSLTVWEGRLQVVSQKPLILVDGAHNGDGAQALVSFLETMPVFDVLVYAAKKGKNIADVLSLILPRCKRVIITKGSYMPEDPDVIARIVRDVGHGVEVRESVSDAVKLGLEYVGTDGSILIAGSLYMIPDALAFLKENEV